MNKQAYQQPVTELTETLTVTTYLQTPSAPNEGISYGGEDDPTNPDDPTSKHRDDDTGWGNLW